MSWTENTESRCNNENCKGTIFWNDLVLHPVTKRRRPLDQPYYPDQGGEPVLHLCMRDKPPKKFINKYPIQIMTADQIRRYNEIPGYTPAQVEAMKDPVIKAEWQKGVQDWLDKWEGLNR